MGNKYTPEQRAAQRAAQREEYARIFGGGTVEGSQYRDEAGQGRSMYRHFTATDPFANNDPTWQWRYDSNGVLWKMPRADQAGRIAAGGGGWERGSEFDTNHYTNWNNFLAEHPGASLEDFIGNKGLKLDVRQGDRTLDPTTGLYYNDPGNDPSARQWFNPFGHLTGGPKGWTPPARATHADPMSQYQFQPPGAPPLGQGFDQYHFQPAGGTAPIPQPVQLPQASGFDNYLGAPPGLPDDDYLKKRRMGF